MRLALVLVILLTGCATDFQSIRWVIGTRDEIQAACGGSFREPVLGCAKHVGEMCAVYTVDSTDDAKLERILGHEVRHCFFGRFHD